MTDLSTAVDLSGLLNKEPEQKAKQLPDPKTYHILCVVPAGTPASVSRLSGRVGSFRVG